MLYPIARPLLFAVDAELAHEISLEMLEQFQCLIPQTQIVKPVEVMGLTFPNPVGLAAGLDKNAEFLGGLSRLGFGFIEVGTVTPLGQPGNPKPRLFRLPRQKSIINRMGFNNQGLERMIERVENLEHDYVLGINIGKNLSTSVENALSDYQTGMQKVYPHADYICINVSSPNTPGLRDLQGEDALEHLLKGLDETRKVLEDQHQYSKPVALKIAPDLNENTIPAICDLLQKYRVDSLIATNTTIDRLSVANNRLSSEAGGLSGEALCDKSRRILELFYTELKDDIPIVSVGGIATAAEAKLRLDLGAKLVQIYSALIYQGPGLVKTILQSL